MKTKIIYISGSEVFEMADVRAAFDEVRNALGLGHDTVLFGVPVDNDDALASKTDVNATAMAPEIIPAAPVITDTPATVADEIPETSIPQDITEPEPEPEITADVVADDPIAEIAVETVTVVADEMPAPVKKSRGRPRKAAVATMDDVADTTDAAPEMVEDAPAADIEPAAPVAESAASEKVIPILSVLASNNATPDVPMANATDDAEPETLAVDADIEIVDVADEIEPVADTADTDVDIIAKSAKSSDEKTLEQLLERMTPLREDHGENIIADESDTDIMPMDIAPDDISPIGDTDATLEQLAAEFANNEDKIIAPAPQSHGKIGKLKNILPFKKARREDSGLMGDLFGWAGVAANDDDFAMPGFFTTAAKK